MDLYSVITYPIDKEIEDDANRLFPFIPVVDTNKEIRLAYIFGRQEEKRIYRNQSRPKGHLLGEKDIDLLNRINNELSKNKNHEEQGKTT